MLTNRVISLMDTVKIKPTEFHSEHTFFYENYKLAHICILKLIQIDTSIQIEITKANFKQCKY